jgi:hypothetical protein
MRTAELLSAITEEITRLEQVKALLSGDGVGPKKRGPKPKATAYTFGVNAAPRKRTISAAGRARIAAAQRARWAKLKAKAK